MAESLGDKLKRIAAEKKAARELATKVTEVTSNEQRSEQPNELGKVCGNEQHEASSGTVGQSQQETTAQDSSVANGTGAKELHDSPLTEQESSSTGQVGSATGKNTEANESTEVEATNSQALVSSEPAVESSSAVISERTTSEHPLSMQFAEMEQALLAADPTFKTILRDVHRQLGNDPELVTMMTEDEIQLVVRGLIVHAKAEIIEPAKAKTIKKDVAAAKKKAISADDL